MLVGVLFGGPKEGALGVERRRWVKAVEKREFEGVLAGLGRFGMGEGEGQDVEMRD